MVLKSGIEFIINDIQLFPRSKLYLVSLQGQAVYSSIGEKEYTPSVIADIDTMIIDNKPFIYRVVKKFVTFLYLCTHTHTDNAAHSALRASWLCSVNAFHVSWLWRPMIFACCWAEGQL